MEFIALIFIVWAIWEVIGFIVLALIGLDSVWRSWIMKSPGGFTYLTVMAWPTILWGYIAWRIKRGQKYRN